MYINVDVKYVWLRYTYTHIVTLRVWYESKMKVLQTKLRNNVTFIITLRMYGCVWPMGINPWL